MSRRTKTPVSFRFPEETRDQLHALAERLGVSQNEAVEMAIRVTYTSLVLVPSVAAAIAAADALADGGRDDPAA